MSSINAVQESQKLVKLLDDLRLLNVQLNSQLTKAAMDESKPELSDSDHSVFDSLKSSIADKKEEIKTQNQVVQKLIASI
ncbi:hypothetical protein B6A42_27345 (plasmid) [Vibrio coralliilyticus]|nr:hypothetical protein B6A42_27345 [Vibrio coralliilyticus]